MLKITRKNVLLLVALQILFAGLLCCGTGAKSDTLLRQEKHQMLRVGMSRLAVYRLLGSPFRVSRWGGINFGPESWFVSRASVPFEQPHLLYITFKGNKVHTMKLDVPGRETMGVHFPYAKFPDFREVGYLKVIVELDFTNRVAGYGIYGTRSIRYGESGLAARGLAPLHHTLYTNLMEH